MLIRIEMLIVAVAALCGCGPITSTTTIADAVVAIEAANGAKADEFAVYEFVSAEQYLRKAREEEGFSDFQSAINFARIAQTFAIKAKERALAAPERGLQTPGEGARGPDDLVPSGSAL